MRKPVSSGAGDFSDVRVSLGDRVRASEAEDISAPLSRLIQLIFVLTTLKKLPWIQGRIFGDLECQLPNGTTLEFRSLDPEKMGIVVDLIARTSAGFVLTIESTILPSSLKEPFLRIYYEARMIAYSDEQRQEAGQLEEFLNRDSVYQVLASLKSVPLP